MENRKEVTDSTAPKPKKPIYKKWWFWVLAVCICIGIFAPKSDNAAPDSVDTPPAGNTQQPESGSNGDPISDDEKKAIAKSVDSQISSICTQAESDYMKFINIMSSGTSSDLELYNNAKTLLANLKHYNYQQLSKIKEESADKYNDSVSIYIFMMSEVADKAMKYIDDPSTSKLSDLQSSIERVSPYLYDVVAKRFDFLTAAGFSPDEISSITTESTAQ